MHFFPSLPLPLPTILFLFLSLTCCHRGCHATIIPELLKRPSATHPPLTNALLLTAAKNGDALAVQQFLDTSITTLSSRGKNEDGWTALMLAADNGHTNIVRLLLDTISASTIETKDSIHDYLNTRSNTYGWTALHYASFENYIDIVQLLLENMQVNVNAKNTEQKTSLMWACEQGHEKIVSVLLGRSRTKGVTIEIDAKDKYGWTALMYAVARRSKKIIQLLLTANANVDVTDNHGKTALMHAKKEGGGSGGRRVQHHLLQREIIEMLAQVATPTEEMFRAAVESNDVTLVRRWLLEKRIIDVDVGMPGDVHGRSRKEERSTTALMWAAEQGHVEMVRLLLYHANANIDATNDKGKNALMVAAFHNHVEIVQLFVSLLRPAGIDARDVQGKTTLMWASYKGHVEIVQCLINANADLNIQEENGVSALMYAAVFGHVTIVKDLIRAKAYVNAQSENGVTALMGASENGHVEIVQLLLEMVDVDSKIKDGNGMTAIMHAKNKHYKEIVAHIEEYDRRVKSEDL